MRHAAIALLIGFACAFVHARAACAATITSATADGLNVITISGRNVKGDSKLFEEFAARIEPGTKTIVTLSGPGGLVIEGMKIGVTIHRYGWSTKVGDGHICLSTCAMIWLSGKPRIASSDAHIGFHAPFDEETHKVDPVALHVLKTYSTIVGLDESAIKFITEKTPGNGLAWLDADAAKANGLDMELVESRLKGKGRFSPATLDRIDVEEARARSGGLGALIEDVNACYATYRKTRADADGFKCYALEVINFDIAKARAKASNSKLDPRFSTNASVERVATALIAAGHKPRAAATVIKRWQADMHATASAK